MDGFKSLPFNFVWWKLFLTLLNPRLAFFFLVKTRCSVFFYWLTTPVCVAVAWDSASQRLRPRRKFIIRRLTRIKCIDSFHGVHHFYRCAFQAGEWGCGSTQRAPCSDHFLWHTRAHVPIIPSRAGLCIQRESSAAGCVAFRLLNHIALVSSPPLHLLFSRHQMALSFHVSLLRCDEWGVRGKMFSGVFIRDCWSQGVNLAVTKNDSVSHTRLPPRRPRFNCLKRDLSKSKGGGESCSVVPRPGRNKNKLPEPVWSQFRCRSGPRTVLCLPVKWTHEEEAMG